LTRTLRKRWILILPAVFVTYSLAYLDRVNYGFGAAAGMAHDLNITKAQSAFLGSTFFIGYLILQVPGSAYAQRGSAVRLIFWAMLGWGTLAAGTGLIRNFWLLAIDRFLLGACESVIMPALLILLFKWFAPSERSRANAILILGNPLTILWMSALTGYLIQQWGWQKAFIIEGAPSILWAFVWIKLVPDSPLDASWMNAEAILYLNESRTTEIERVLEPAAFSKVISDRNVLLLCAQFFFWSIALYGLVLWLPTIVRHRIVNNMGVAGIVSSIPYLFASAAMLLVAQFSDKSGRRSLLVWPFLFFAGITMFSSFVVSSHSIKIAYLFLIATAVGIYAPYGPYWANVPETLPEEMLGKAIGLINGSGAAGGILGVWLVGVLQVETGNLDFGFLLMSLSLIVSSGLILFVRRSNAESG